MISWIAVGIAYAFISVLWSLHHAVLIKPPMSFLNLMQFLVDSKGNFCNVLQE